MTGIIYSRKYSMNIGTKYPSKPILLKVIMPVTIENMMLRGKVSGRPGIFIRRGYNASLTTHEDRNKEKRGRKQRISKKLTT